MESSLIPCRPLTSGSRDRSLRCWGPESHTCDRLTTEAWLVKDGSPRLPEYRAEQYWTGWWGGWGDDRGLTFRLNSRANDGWTLISTKSTWALYFWIFPRPKLLLLFERPATVETVYSCPDCEYELEGDETVCPQCGCQLFEDVEPEPRRYRRINKRVSGSDTSGTAPDLNS